MRTKLIVAVAALLCFAASKEQRPAPAEKPIHVSDLDKRKVIGWLGHPLGEVVVIEGVGLDGDELHEKYYSCTTLLKIQRVQGKDLSMEVVLEFDDFRSDSTSPRAGERFKLLGYETGRFDGCPEGASKYTLRQTNGYSFTSSFRILKRIDTKK